MKEVLFSMDDTLHKMLEMEAVKRGCPQHEVIEEALQKHLVGGRELPLVDHSTVGGPRIRVTVKFEVEETTANGETLGSYYIEGIELPDGRVLTRQTGTDGRDPLWSCIEAVMANGADYIIGWSYGDPCDAPTSEEMRMRTTESLTQS